MAIYWECPCPECRRQNPLVDKKSKQKIETCLRCGKGRKKASPAFWAEWSLPLGSAKKRGIKRLYGFTETQAKEYEQEQRVKTKRGEYIPDSVNGIRTLQQLVDRYLYEIEIDKPGHYADAKRYCDRLLEFFTGSMRCSNLTDEHIRRYQLWLKGEKRFSDVYNNLHIQNARSAWNRCFRKKLDNPFSQVKQYPEPAPRVEYLTPEELHRLLNTILERGYRDLYEIIAIACFTGLRRENVLQLKRSEVSFERKLIQLITKGGKMKTFPLPPAAEQILSQIPPTGTDYFWISPVTGSHWSKPDKAYKSCLRQAGVTRDFHWHDMRHTAATLFLMISRDIRATQSFLGHKSLRSTERYAHLIDSVQQGYLEQMASLLPGDHNGTHLEDDTQSGTQSGTQYNSEPLDNPSYIQ